MRLRKAILAVTIAGAMAIPATALATPPDNRPPDRGNHGGNQGQGQTQGQTQGQSQCILVLGLLMPATC